ncbi:YggS family pyridoxal phosphate-dependent enzyme [Exilibacterium tricleocarpae]|uniref:Pyridoxal phosphate homeostasis protein n=1 Tax=Exilibacterium tricleocarpae TaxID=2591008 RepID=A0A545SXD7_9GAMM|nr:YggS family pyridoxal phosphate-dependent enzyme [Exilibacterium tricleocarpae]TQV69627.1 YggS family pyridoxal phosphate-dependent enzyme [Exilibacterium tricleocarpae]
MHKIADNLKKVSARIEQAAHTAARETTEICLLAVSKTRSAGAIRRACDCGQRQFGENYLQEALEKQTLLTDLDLEWHFIGPIQSNKTRAIAENFDWVHSVDRVKVARRLSEQRPPARGPLNICLQINTDAEATKAGVDYRDLEALAAQVSELPALRLRGLMAIPARRTEPAQQQAVFEQVAAALERLQKRLPQAPLDTLSMGMSADLEAAIAAGATIVRVGTDIFGPRNP